MAVTAAVADEPEPTGPLEPFEPADRAVLAFHHAAEVGDWDELDRLWSAGIVAMVRDDAGLLRRTLDHLPAPVVAARPSMGVFRDALPVWASDSDEDGYQATLRAYADSSARYLGPAWEQLPMGDLLIVGTGYLVHLRLAGRLVESAAVGARIAGVLVGQRPSGRALDGRTAWFHLQRAMTSTVLLDDAAAIRAYHRAWERGTGAGVDVVRAHAAANLAFTFALEGDGPRSRRWSDRSRSIDVVPADARQRPADRLPLAGRIAAGLPIEAAETAESISLSDVVGNKDCFALEVRGDSMRDEHIVSGDYVLVERTRTARQGEIVVALVRGAETTLKRFFLEGSQVRLQPANLEMEPIFVHAAQVAIQGRVLGVLRRYR